MDFLLLQAVLRELQDCLAGATVTKVTQPASAVVVLAVRSPAWTGHLLLSAEPGAARIHTTETAFENPPRPPAFCQALRGAVRGRRLGAPTLVGGDRVMALPFVHPEPDGEPEEVTLVAELTGQQAALVLVKGPAPEGTIVQVVGAGRTRRRLALGGAYAPPPWPAGAAAFDAYTPASLAEALSAPDLAARPVARRLVHVVMGLSPLAAREVCPRAGLDPEANAVAAEEAR
ncbi:MAG: NFACT family protein, partial [Nitrospinota bacterium]